MSLNVLQATNDQWLSNTYLVWSQESKQCAMVDAGGPVRSLLAEIEQRNLELTHVLLTHHHYDHVAELSQVVAAHPEAALYAHPLESSAVSADGIKTLEDGDQLQVDGLTVKAIHTPGHSAGMLALLIGGSALFTGDTLFKGSVGGIRAPGHTTFEDIKHSIMDRLMTLDPAVTVYPGHSDTTSIATEWEDNPFIRLWRGLDVEDGRQCKALGESATVVVTARDYDGGSKVWVRWPDGQDDILPGSVVEVAS